MEIGSEFWHADVLEKNNITLHGNIRFLLSGRTALDYIIRDIKKKNKFVKVMLPSYCCDSMIEPFKRNRIKVQFYPVTENGINYPKNDADAVLLIDFFGFTNIQNENIAVSEKNNGKVVIYDATHKLNALSFEADYVFCSYRKWTYSNTAIAIKNCGVFNNECPTVVHDKYLQMRDAGALLKSRYMFGENINKQDFLRLFADSEELLKTDYTDYSGEFQSIDVEKIVSIRRINAEYLMESLRDVTGVRLWRKKLSENDAPLFVPILVDKNKRNILRKHLIQNNIYCPVHWPLTDKHGDYKEMYDRELSLICDQRYSLKDMARQVAAIREFFKNEVL